MIQSSRPLQFFIVYHLLNYMLYVPAVLSCISSSSEAPTQLQPGNNSISSSNSSRRALAQKQAAPKEEPQYINGSAAVVGLPEAKIVSTTYLYIYSSMKDPNLRGKFQALLSIANVGVSSSSSCYPIKP
jgi:hypothetical protein